MHIPWYATPMDRHDALRGWGLAIMVLGGACTTAPYHNQVIASTGTAINVSGWTLFEERNITVECRPYFIGNAWTAVAPAVSTTGFDIAISGETWYYFTGSVVIPSSCWFHWHSQYTTELRFRDDDGYTYQVFDENGLDCLYGGLGSDPPSALGMNCSQDVDRIYVHAPG